MGIWVLSSVDNVVISTFIHFLREIPFNVFNQDGYSTRCWLLGPSNLISLPLRSIVPCGHVILRSHTFSKPRELDRMYLGSQWWAIYVNALLKPGLAPPPLSTSLQKAPPGMWIGLARVGTGFIWFRAEAHLVGFSLGPCWVRILALARLIVSRFHYVHDYSLFSSLMFLILQWTVRKFMSPWRTKKLEILYEQLIPQRFQRMYAISSLSLSL